MSESTHTHRWLKDSDYDLAIRSRYDMIEDYRRVIVESQGRIAIIENEISIIELERSKIPALPSPQPPYIGTDNPEVKYSHKIYNAEWSWFDKALFILRAIKEYKSAKEIVIYLTGLDKELKADKKLQRQAQGAIINAMKPRVKSGLILTQVGEDKVLRYGLS